MGARLSAHQNRKRVSSRLQPSIKTTASQNGSATTTSKIASSNKAPSTSSQSSDGIIRNGRKFHNETSSVYWFPNDDEEMDRLVGVRTQDVDFIFNVLIRLLFLQIATFCPENVIQWVCLNELEEPLDLIPLTVFVIETSPRKHLKMARFHLKMEPRY